MTDILSELRPRWREQGLGIDVRVSLLRFLCWADDAWLFAETPEEINCVLEHLRREALARADLVLRLSTCTRTVLRRSGQAQGDHSAELRHLLRKAWAAYHSRRRIWATPCCFTSKVRIVHLSV